MKKLLLLTFLFAFAFFISACSTQTNNEENITTDNPVSEAENQKEEIKTADTQTTIDGINEGDTINSPVTISGKTNASKNTLFVELRDSEHVSKVKGYAIVTENDDAQNDYKITLNFIFNSTKEGYIAVYELDKDGLEKNLVEIPVNYKTAE